VVLTEGHDIYRPFAGDGRFGELMHSPNGHVDEVVFAFRLSRVAIGDLQDDSAGFFLDVFKEIVWRV
jgi:hypothetical protein